MKNHLTHCRSKSTAGAKAAVRFFAKTIHNIPEKQELIPSGAGLEPPRRWHAGWLVFTVILAFAGTIFPAVVAAGQNGGTKQERQPAATLTSISMTPSSVTTAPGNSGQFTATGNYSDGSKKNLNTVAKWASTAPSIVTVNSTGLATTVASGTGNITATVGSIVGSAKVTVTGNVVLQSISVTPPSVSIPAGARQQFTATGNYSDGSKQDLTSTAYWSSSAMSVAVPTGHGMILSTTQGSATIVARSGSIYGTSSLTATAPVLSLISVTPTGASIALGTAQQFSATGTYSDGSTQNLTNAVTWTSSVPQVASVTTNGVVTALATGATALTAVSGTLHGYAGLKVAASAGSISNFKHIIVVDQENRTPDNMFQGLCAPPYGNSNSCSTKPSASQYNIQTSNWLDNTSSTGFTQPAPWALAGGYDLNHDHVGFVAMCDMDSTGHCRMDGAAHVGCGQAICPPHPQFVYVDNSAGIMNPDLSIASQYGFGNYMFQTNQGASFPAHLFLFGGTAAASASGDASGMFAAGNMLQVGVGAGCATAPDTTVPLIGPAGENLVLYPPIYPCFEYQTLSDLLDDAGISWKYYASTGPLSIWTSPNSIEHICQANGEIGHCTGSDFLNDVEINSAGVLTDINECTLPGVSWVTPTAPNSDHPTSNTGGGPSWIASIVNSVGNRAKCPNGETYWDNTAIFVTWDDWGGYYDHEAPIILGGAQGDYQYGFRVPLLVVSAYTPAGYIDNNRADFGSILRFIEYNFGFDEGVLNFADARALSDLTEYFNLNQAPRTFQTIPAPLDAAHFINEPTTAEEPDEY